MVVRLVRALRPREGWDAFLVLLAAVLCLPGAAVAADWVPGDEGLLPLAVCALLVGRWLALGGDWGWSVWLPVGASLGLLAALGVAAHALPSLPGSGEATFDFAQRWVTWLQVAFSGGTSEDPDVFLFYAALLCWVAVLFAAWAFYRRQRPLLALLPLAVLSAVTVFYSGRGILWLVGGLGCGVLVLAAGHFTRERWAWETAGVDYASGIGPEVLAVALIVAIPVVLISMFGPLLTARRVSEWYRRIVEGPTEQVEDTAERLFGGVSPPRGPAGDEWAGPGTGASSYLPESRLLGGRPDLLDQVVMLVRTDEPPPPPPPPEDYYYPPEPAKVPPHYWRGATMDYYSGRGWATTIDARAEVDGELPLPAPLAYREVTQYFEFIAPHGDTLFAMNAPAWVGAPVEARWVISPSASLVGEEGGDLAGLASDVISFTVVSYLPTPTADDLRVILPLYPSEVIERYLQLPDTLPQRVIDLAWEVVAGGETVYERARLLERYLRAYPYSLEVDTPPEDRDVVDYFLFDMREGYCDYYATAFVVMARVVGIPARMASGFVGGQYDYGREAYRLRQRNGHSWPEVYFPGWGWIGFEPTAAQVVTELSEEVALPEATLPGPTGPPARVVRLRWRVARLGIVVLAGLGLAGRVWLQRRRRRVAQVVTLPLVWGWVGRGGARMGLSPDLALTPREYAAALAAELHARAQRTGRWNTRWTGLAAQGGAALDHLAAFYGAQVYGRPQPPAADEEVARGVWARLRRPLRWFRWLGWVQWIGERVGGSSALACDDLEDEASRTRAESFFATM